MSLSTRILLLLSVVVVLFVGADVTVFRVLVHRRFDELERQLAQERMQSSFAKLQAEVRFVDSVASYLVEWHSTGEEKSSELDLGPQSLEGCGVELLMLLDSFNRVIWQRIEDPESRERIELVDFPSGSLSPSHPLLDQEPVSGFMLTERGPMIISSRSIRSSEDGSGGGRVLAGRFFGTRLATELGEGGNVSFTLFAAEDLPMHRLSAVSQESLLLGRNEDAIEVDSNDRLNVYRSVKDVRGFPLMVAKVGSERTVTQRGLETANDSLLSGIAIASLLLLTLTKLLEVTVISPVRRLTNHASTLGSSDRRTLRLNSTRGDEIGMLSRELDRMVDELERTRHVNVDMARRAGKSEVAAGVVHNVGNSLNSITVSAGLTANVLQSLPAEDLKVALGALLENRTDLDRYLEADERGKHLLPYLVTLEEGIRRSRSIALQEMHSLLEGVDRIEQLVASQESSTKQGALDEWTDLTQILRDTMQGARSINDFAAGCDVEFEFDELPDYRVDRHRMTQILLNLILNAVDALQEAECESPRIVLRATTDEHGAGVLEVSDNGQGILDVDLERVFHAGFSTREAGRGYGLHDAANAATEIGASLTCTSAGFGEGATFRLVVPPDRGEQSRAA